MKQTLLLPIFLFTLHLSAQVPYTPFNFETGIWKEMSYALWHQKEYSIFATGDTLINNVLYHKLQKEGTYNNDSSDPDSIWHPFSEYAGAVRENDQKQVEYIFPNWSNVVILYDFSNIAEGDTIDVVGIDGGLGATQKAHVFKMDTVNICGQLRNRYHLNFEFEPLSGVAHLVEGIGSNFGLFQEYEIFESGTHFVCYSQENCVCGELVLADRSTASSTMSISLFPNPAHAELLVKTKEGIRNSELRVFNFYGQQIWSGKLEGTEKRIHCENWENGIYLLVFNDADSDKLRTQKVIVMH